MWQGKTEAATPDENVHVCCMYINDMYMHRFLRIVLNVESCLHEVVHLQNYMCYMYATTI